eukprot:2466721-Pleurochrysis_carterae.AAC.1
MLPLQRRRLGVMYASLRTTSAAKISSTRERAMAPPGYRIKKVTPAPARDTASESQPTLWRMNPESDEPFDPARCLEVTDTTKEVPADSTSVH